MSNAIATELRVLADRLDRDNGNVNPDIKVSEALALLAANIRRGCLSLEFDWREFAEKGYEIAVKVTSDYKTIAEGESLQSTVQAALLKHAPKDTLEKIDKAFNNETSEATRDSKEAAV